jgi:hypothetical protein
MINFSEAFHWTPKQIREIDEEDKMYYNALLQGKGMAKSDK